MEVKYGSGSESGSEYEVKREEEEEDGLFPGLRKVA